MHYHGHRERLRVRLQESPDKLADYEILELLLGYVLLRRDTKPIAKELLTQFTNIRGILDAKHEELIAVAGVGPGIVTFLTLLREVMSRYVECPVRAREVLSSPQAVASMARQRLGKLSHEEIWIAYVDNQNRLIAWERATKGTVNTAVIYPRDIMERALALKATGFIMVHNHPGGDPTPSPADLELTKRMQQAAHTLAIRFLDHVIVTDNSCYTLMNEGIIS